MSAAEDAIREFPFWNYGMDDVDPKSEYAEWVPDLAAKVEAAVRAQVAADIDREGIRVHEAAGDRVHELARANGMIKAWKIARGEE